MSRGLVQPFFPNPPKEYQDAYMAEVVRAFSVFLSQVNNAGPWRATDLVLKNLQTNDQGLEIGALFNQEGTLKIVIANSPHLSGLSATGGVGSVSVTT